ncbi:MAG: sulfotransferase [Parafilimonas sp.]|nr:sulfotransferase [Parafilimonas sp.]
MTKFVIFTLPRTGSTLLSKSLNKHPDIFCDDEIFHFSFRDYFSPNQFRFLKLPFLPKKINYVVNYPATYVKLKPFLDKYFTNKPNENFKARGFKLMYYQTFYTPGLISYLKKNNVKVILLLRENILRNALSDLRARSTGIYHNQDDNEEQRSGLSKLNVDTNELQQKMSAIVRQNKKLTSIISDMDHIKIRYEDFGDWDKTMNRIAAFLNVSTTSITAGAKKLNPDNLQDMIANYDEVASWLKQNNYAEFVV